MLITKLRFAAGNGVQIICISATMGNLESIVDWLGARLFITNYRPIQLQEHVVFETEVYAVSHCLKPLQRPPTNDIKPGLVSQHARQSDAQEGVLPLLKNPGLQDRGIGIQSSTGNRTIVEKECLDSKLKTRILAQPRGVLESASEQIGVCRVDVVPVHAGGWKALSKDHGAVVSNGKGDVHSVLGTFKSAGEAVSSENVDARFELKRDVSCAGSCQSSLLQLACEVLEVLAINFYC